MPRVQTCVELSFDLQVGGRRLRAKAITPPKRDLADGLPVMVFLHEGLGSITQWRDFPRSLVRATGLPALVYDRYGHGQSEALAGPKLPLYLEEEAVIRLPEVLSGCGINAPILIGHSDGATIALLYAAAFPKTVLGVVSEAAHVFIEQESIQGIWRTLQAFETTPLREQLARHHGEKVDSMFRGWSNVWLSPGYQDWSMLERLPRIQAPVLAIQGEDDQYGTPAQVHAITNRVAGPSQGLLIPGCAHVPHFQAREKVLAEVTTFVQGLVKHE